MRFLFSCCFPEKETGADLKLYSFIFYYGTTFFKRSGIKNPFMISVITNVVNVVMTIPGILSVDRFGRRALVRAYSFFPHSS